MININDVSLADKNILNFTKEELFESVEDIFSLEPIEKVKVQALMQTRANELGIGDPIAQMISDYTILDNEENGGGSKRNKSGGTIEKFLSIMTKDKLYKDIKYNVLSNCAELPDDKGIPRHWTDADEAQSKMYIEKKYHIHNDKKHSDALKLLFRMREYHPVQELVKGIEWDGENRIEHFLTQWAKADDTPYVREVSRLIFAGGIHRLFNPGCKFDDVPVLIGTAQGEGKSTLVRWLAMNDLYYTEANEIDGPRSIEQLDGAWICEFSELLALTKSKEQEAVKSYITRQKDKYRRPYDKNPIEYPRRCIFIGTTNNETFLRDKTGNRRFYPVVVHSNGYWLYEHEEECRDYIAQCWAEAKARLDKGEMPGYADMSLRDEYKAAQEEAMEDDWRIGVIGKYLDEKEEGELVCIRELAHKALSPNPEFPKDLSRKESVELSNILTTYFSPWVKVGLKWTTDYGTQRCWRRKRETNREVEIL